MNADDFIVLFLFLNLFMWFFAIKYMCDTNKKHFEVEKKLAEMNKKQYECLHLNHNQVLAMTEMNINSMGQFLDKISDAMKPEENETEDRQ